MTGDINLRRGATFTIQGNVVGNITMVSGSGFTIMGSYGQAGGGFEVLEVEFIRNIESGGGDLTIGSVVDARIMVNDAIDTNGRLRIEGDVTDSNIWIEAIGDGSVEIGFTKAPGAASITNTSLFFGNGLVPASTLDFRNARMIGGFLAMGLALPKDMDGTLLLYEFGGDLFAVNMAGDMTVTSDFSAGSVTLTGDMWGAIDVGGNLGGDINIGGDYLFFGTIDVAGSVTGDIIVDGDAQRSINIGQSLDGMIQVNQDILIFSTLSMDRMGPTGRIDVAGEFEAFVLIANDFDGTILAGLPFIGQVIIGGDANGSLSASGASAGYYLVDGAIAGDISIPADMSGNIHADADGNGQGDITGNVTVTGVYDGDICGANLTPGGLLPINIDIQNFGPAGTICGGCQSAGDCADLDANGIRDDSCVWWDCDAGFCQPTNTVHPSDMGGGFGACPADSFCNMADARHALTCFASTNPCDEINIDAGGAYADCALDGYCNLADALHALTCLQGTNSCTCGASATGSSPPEVVGATSLRVVRSPLSTQSDTITVRVFTETALDDLQSYQLELRVSGGISGQFDLLDIFIESRSDYVFAGLQDNFTAFNTVSGQMLSGLIDVSAGVQTPLHAYLATYTYRASPTATGDFVVDVPHDASLGDQTFLVASFNKKIEVTDSTPAVVATAP